MINDSLDTNIQPSSSADAAAAAPAVDGGSVVSRHHKSVSQDSSNLDTHLKGFNQFIYLGAAEEAGRQEDHEDQVAQALKMKAGRQHSEGSSTSSLDIMSVQDNENLKDDFSEFIDIPHLVSDNESDEITTQSTSSFTQEYWHQKRATQETPASVASTTQESIFSPAPAPAAALAPEPIVTRIATAVAPSPSSPPPAATNTTAQQQIRNLRKSQHHNKATKSPSSNISPQLFKHQRTQLMNIIVKYVATKIYNAFPPDSSRKVEVKPELAIDKFLLILISRSQVSLSTFLKSIIYLFRYMDIIYLLRYLNQTNNFVQYNDMGFELKKLIVGCFKLTVLKENKGKKAEDKSSINWEAITGLKNSEINAIVKQLINRMNGKLNIKDIELVRIKNEMFRFVKMISVE
ncbi:uncharacterized protein LODBEIA_P43740 [Lodderomyces beijingensis]|uniref:Uncharacterized protein n=1 Tax=Lodderomyces beijingensis TaxID=1775926 RepID=A0ABP0ZPS5_9ASCO